MEPNKQFEFSSIRNDLIQNGMSRQYINIMKKIKEGKRKVFNILRYSTYFFFLKFKQKECQEYAVKYVSL